jgi:hypothetical protein
LELSSTYFFSWMLGVTPTYTAGSVAVTVAGPLTPLTDAVLVIVPAAHVPLASTVTLSPAGRLPTLKPATAVTRGSVMVTDVSVVGPLLATTNWYCGTLPATSVTAAAVESASCARAAWWHAW